MPREKSKSVRSNKRFAFLNNNSDISILHTLRVHLNMLSANDDSARILRKIFPRSNPLCTYPLFVTYLLPYLLHIVPYLSTYFHPSFIPSRRDC